MVIQLKLTEPGMAALSTARGIDAAFDVRLVGPDPLDGTYRLHMEIRRELRRRFGMVPPLAPKGGP